MRKSEMSLSEASTHEAIVSTLAAAGWEPQGDQIKFEAGGWTIYDIDMYRFNGRARLRVFRDLASEELGFVLKTVQGKTLGLYLQCGSNLQQVLDAIVEIQEAIDQRTYKQYVARLVHLCPGVFASTDELERVRLIDRKSGIKPRSQSECRNRSPGVS